MVGHFIATIESRISNYEKAEIRYVRFYVNWDGQHQTNQSLRARIASRITPMKKSLEMIELPLNFNPASVAVCPSTGNVLVSHKNNIQLFLFKYCTNEATKLQYIDFFEAPFQIEMNMVPSKILMNENIICCCNKQFVYAFKVVERKDGNNSTTSESNTNISSTEIAQLSKISTIVNLEEEVDFKSICDKQELNGYQFNVKIMSTEQEVMTSALGDEIEMRPSIVNELGANIKFIKNLPNYSFSVPSKFCIQNLLQLKLQPMKINGIFRENNDIFKCMFMRPIYFNPNVSAASNASVVDEMFFMHSKLHLNFKGCSILVTTQQDGYLYQIHSSNRDTSHSLLNAYPFTSSVVDVYFDDCFLHALCENGIESYTHRLGQNLLLDRCDNIYRNLTTAISLVNLRPFLNVRLMIPNESNLVLLASDSSATPMTGEQEDSVIWTIYSLKYPLMNTIYEDYTEFADKNLKKYPSVYINLLEEIHLMIRTHMALGKLELEENSETGHEIRLVLNDCWELLKKSSLALADTLIT